MIDGNMAALNKHLAEREEYDRHQELLDAEKERDQLAERVEELEAKLSAMCDLWASADSDKQALCGRIDGLEAQLAATDMRPDVLVSHMSPYLRQARYFVPPTVLMRALESAARAQIKGGE